jgi:hypothetical protein
MAAVYQYLQAEVSNCMGEEPDLDPTSALACITKAFADMPLVWLPDKVSGRCWQQDMGAAQEPDELLCFLPVMRAKA